jgi:phosphatidate cytidylyltransferase
MIRNQPGALESLAFVFGGTWGCDTFAFFLGIRYGKRKLNPRISPKKTWEGAAGGVLGSIVMVSIVGLVAGIEARHFIPLGFVIAAAAQLGDLVESSLKRYVDIKDSGNLIPGHGGILDRCDSLIFVAPVVYYYIQVFII